MLLRALSALVSTMLSKVALDPPQVVDCPSATKNPFENFKTMRLQYRTRVTDELGRWWIVEVRQCPYTGVLLRKTERITD